MTPLRAFLTKSVLDLQTKVVDNHERKVSVENQQKIPKEMRDTPSGVPKMRRNPKSILLRNELFLGVIWNTWNLIPLMMNAMHATTCIFMQWNYKPEKMQKRRG